MTRSTCGATVVLLLASLAVPAVGQNYFLYTPKPLTVEDKGHPKDGILVREITVQKGDTLSALSRKFSGRASYFPQILLFNDIRNPNMIYTGNNLKIPVTRNESTEPPKHAVSPSPQQSPAARPAAQPVGELSLSDLKKTDAPRQKKQPQHAKKKNRHTPADAKRASKTSAVAAKETSSGIKLFEQAHAAYRQGNCTAALELFDRFLAANPNSSQVADASLYKADCYLKLSGQ